MARNIIVTRAVTPIATVVKSTPVVTVPVTDPTVTVTRANQVVTNNFVLIPGPPGAAGPAGPAGPADAALLKVHEQTSAAATWFITHNFGRLPVVTVYVDGQDVLVPLEATTMSVTITLPSPRTGVAVLR